MPRYRHYEQGYGDILTPPFKSTLETVDALGTYRCRTCLCVYIRFTNNHVFIAHMIAMGMETPPGDGTDYDFVKVWSSGPEKGKLLKEAVLAQLHARLPAYVNRPVAEGFLVCPTVLRGEKDGSRANGWWMRLALEEFFGSVVTLQGHGFIAGPGVETVVLGWKSSGQDPDKDATAEKEVLPEECGWVAANGVQTEQEIMHNEAGPWDFRFYDGQWNVRK